MDNYEGLRRALAVAEHRAEQTGPDGFPLVGSVERAQFLIDAVRMFLDRTEIHPDLADDREDVRDAHHVEVSWTAYGPDGTIWYNSDMEITGAQAAGMFQGIGEAWPDWRADL